MSNVNMTTIKEDNVQSFIKIAQTYKSTHRFLNVLRMEIFILNFF